MLVTDSIQCDFFEGTEKLLEVWFGAAEATNQNVSLDLRTIPRHELDNLLGLVKAEIVSFTSNRWTDSYVLSESSMFVSENRFIIKTCGTTCLLDCLGFLLGLAEEYCGFDCIKNLFYSRRVYLKPEMQQGMHQCFETEVKYLKEFVPNGSSYILGQNPGEEWYLFTMDNAVDFDERSDVTLEILMSELDQKKMVQFAKACHPNAEQMTKKTGIADLIPGAIHDGVVFDPIGYSMNGLYKDSYHTIHITPQEECSYVSFETNLKLKDYSKLVDQVVKTFNPGKFILTMFISKDGKSSAMHRRTLSSALNVEGYQRVDLDQPQLKNYSLTYGCFLKCNA